MSIKNLKYDLTPQEIFEIFMRDYDKYTKEEINIFLEYLIDESEKYVKAVYLIRLYDDIKTSRINRFVFLNKDLDIFVNTLSKFLYESTNINVNEPIIIDENVYMNYLNYLGRGGKLLTTRLENDYIFNYCIHSKVGYMDWNNYSYTTYPIKNDFYNDGNYFIQDEFSNYQNEFRLLPIYLEFGGYDGVYYGWINQKQFSNVAGVFFPMPGCVNSTIPELPAEYLAAPDGLRWFDFSAGDFVVGSWGDYNKSGAGGLSSNNLIVKKDNSFILNCNLPNYIFSPYIDSDEEGFSKGIFARSDNYHRISSWSNYVNNFPITTEYNPLDGDKSYRATPKFGTGSFWNIRGIIFKNDKDFMQVIKKEDVKHQGSLGWMKNNFYISNFIYIPEIYIFTKFLYTYSGNDDNNSVIVKQFRNLINNVINNNQPLDQLLLFILHAYVLEFEDDQFYADTKEYQELMYLENSIGIINFIKDIDICEIFYNSWGKTFIGNNNILKNISYSNYKMIDSDKTFDYFSSYIELSPEFSTKMLNFFGLAENVNIGIPNTFWEFGSGWSGGYTSDSLFNTADYRCSFFYRKENDNKTHLAMIHKEGNVLKIRDSIIIFDKGKIFFVGNWQKEYTPNLNVTGSVFDNLKEYMINIYPNVVKYSVLKLSHDEESFGLFVNNLNFSILIVESDYLSFISNNSLVHDNISLFDIVTTGNFDNIFDEDGIYRKSTIDLSSKFEKQEKGIGRFMGPLMSPLWLWRESHFYKTHGSSSMEFYINEPYFDDNNNYVWIGSDADNDAKVSEAIYGHKNRPDERKFVTYCRLAGVRFGDGVQKIIFAVIDIAYHWKDSYITYEEGANANDIPGAGGILHYNYDDIRCIPEGYPAYSRVIEIPLEDEVLQNLSLENVEYLYKTSAIGDEMLIQATNKTFENYFLDYWYENNNLRLMGWTETSYVKINEFSIDRYFLFNYQSYIIPNDISGTTITLNRKVLKKSENEMVNQDISNITVEMLDRAFDDWDKVPFYMYKTRVGKKELAIVKGQFLTRLLGNIRNNHFKLIAEEAVPIEDPTIEEK